MSPYLKTIPHLRHLSELQQLISSISADKYSGNLEKITLMIEKGLITPRNLIIECIRISRYRINQHSLIASLIHNTVFHENHSLFEEIYFKMQPIEILLTSDFLYSCFHSGLIQISPIIKHLKKYLLIRENPDNFRVCRSLYLFFIPEIRKADQELFYALKAYYRVEYHELTMKGVHLYHQERNHASNTIYDIIFRDDVKSLQNIFADGKINKISEINIKRTFFEIVTSENIIELIGIFGAIKCFKFLLFENIIAPEDLSNEEILVSAFVRGGNSELIVMLLDLIPLNPNKKAYFAGMAAENFHNDLFFWFNDYENPDKDQYIKCLYSGNLSLILSSNRFKSRFTLVPPSILNEDLIVECLKNDPNYYNSIVKDQLLKFWNLNLELREKIFSSGNINKLLLFKAAISVNDYETMNLLHNESQDALSEIRYQDQVFRAELHHIVNIIFKNSILALADQFLPQYSISYNPEAPSESISKDLRKEAQASFDFEFYQKFGLTGYICNVLDSLISKPLRFAIYTVNQIKCQNPNFLQNINSIFRNALYESRFDICKALLTRKDCRKWFFEDTYFLALEYTIKNHKVSLFFELVGLNLYTIGNDDKVDFFNWAVSSSPKLAQKMIEKNFVDINAKSRDGKRLFEIAFMDLDGNPYDDLVKFFFSQPNFNLKALSRNGESFLHICASNNFIDLAIKIMKWPKKGNSLLSLGNRSGFLPHQVAYMTNNNRLGYILEKRLKELAESDDLTKKKRKWKK